MCVYVREVKRTSFVAVFSSLWRRQKVGSRAERCTKGRVLSCVEKEESLVFCFLFCDFRKRTCVASVRDGERGRERETVRGTGGGKEGGIRKEVRNRGEFTSDGVLGSEF